MSSNWRGACALIVAAAVAGGASAQSFEADAASQQALAYPGAVAVAVDGEVDAAAGEAAGGEVQLAACEVCEDYGDCGCDAGELTCSGGGLGGRMQTFVGAEYLSVRANFSEATAYRIINAADFTETFEQFDFDYGDSFRVFGGLRMSDCGAELRFTYTNFDSSGSFGPIEDDGDSLTTVGVPYLEPGDTISGTASVEVDSYDIGFAKTIPLGSPICDTGCGDCCDPCGCGDSCGCGSWCPAWDIQWSGGIRVANVDSELGYFSASPDPSIADRSESSRVSFDGVGLRTGLLGRRYFGKQGLASVFVRGDISLLLGEVENSAGGNGTYALTTLESTEVIPVTEIEAGGTLYLTKGVSFSGGYLLSAWHDLGHRFEYDFSGTGTQTVLADDANMLMFDGWFLRLEAFF